MLTAFRIVMMLWPFIKETFFGQKTASEILSAHKMRAAMAVLVAASFMLNVFVVGKLIDISANYLALEKKYKAEVAHKTPVVPVALPAKVSKPAVVEVVPVDKADDPPPVVTVAPKKKRGKTEEQLRFERIKKSMEDMRRREIEEEAASHPKG